MRKAADCDYDKRNIYVDICNTDNGQPSHGGDIKIVEV